MTLAQYALRAKKWALLLRERIGNLEPDVDSDETETAQDNDPTEHLPVMSLEDRRNSGSILLMLLAQAYYKMLESSISLASWCSALDIELNQSYFWTVTMITNLLKNHEDLKDFPVAFEPIFPDLYPSTIRDVDWEEMIAPDAESFLSTVQQYVHSKGIYDPEQGSSAWVFIELYRPGVNMAIERANAYHKKMTDYCRQRGITPPQPTMTEDTQTLKKTVLELDLVGYSSISSNLEESLDVSSVAQVNQQIQTFIEVGLKAANASREENVMSLTGDGAILLFDSAQQAHDFAAAVNRATQEHNRTRKQQLAMRVFRSGAASGEISVKRKAGGGYDIAGSTIARAVRLEAKALPGGILVDKATFDALLPGQQLQYGSKQVVSGKRDERFEAYAAELNPDGAKAAAFFTGAAETDVGEEPPVDTSGSDQRRQILSGISGLKGHQYLEMVFLLEIPIGQRPADTLNLDQQKAQILKWAEENQRLDAVLQVLGELAETKSRTS